jgi:hypothetical protein
MPRQGINIGWLEKDCLRSRHVRPECGNEDLQITALKQF